MKQQITIRKLCLTDLDIFYSLFSTLVNSQFSEYTTFVKKFMLTSKKAWNRNVYKTRLTRKNRLILGAFVNKELVGILEATHPEFGVSFCSWLMVEPNMHKKGVGKKLIQNWEEIMKKKGVHSLYLNADNRNLEYYKKLGFTLVGIYKKAWFGLDTLYFAKQIQEPRAANYLK